MKKAYFLGLFSLVIFCLIWAYSFAGDAETDALKAAEEWLALIDADDYGSSWDQAAELFRRDLSGLKKFLMCLVQKRFAHARLACAEAAGNRSIASVAGGEAQFAPIGMEIKGVRFQVLILRTSQTGLLGLVAGDACFFQDGFSQ